MQNLPKLRSLWNRSERPEELNSPSVVYIDTTTRVMCATHGRFEHQTLNNHLAINGEKTP